MRFFEFKLPEPGSVFAKELEQYVIKLINAAKTLPETDPRRAEFDQFLQKLKVDAGIKEDAVADADQATINAILSFLAKKGSKEATRYLLDGAEILGDEAVMSALQASAETHKQTGKEERSAEIQQFFSGLEDQLKTLAAKAAPNDKILKDIVRNFKAAFGETVLRDRKITQEDLSQFLNDAIDSHIIDMNAMVGTNEGNIGRFITNPKHKEIFDVIKDDIFSYIPGGTGANIGPGEVALTMFGNPIRKGDIGDLEIDGVMYEVKGGRTRGKESGYGGRLNGKAVLKPTSGLRVINEYFKKKLPDVPAVAKSEKGKPISRFNWNPKGINNLNFVVGENIKRKDRKIAFMQGLMYELWSTLITNHEEIKNFDQKVLSIVEADGNIDPANAMRITTELLYESYALSDGEKVRGKPQFNIIVLNAGTLNYQIIRKPQDISKVQIVGGISWTDANQSTSPQLFTP